MIFHTDKIYTIQLGEDELNELIRKKIGDKL